MPQATGPVDVSPRGLSRRARWSGGETIASVLMARTLDQPSGRRHMLRLSFGIPSCESIHRGVAALARAVKHVM